MTSQPKFEIVYSAAIYCDRDSIIGVRAIPTERTYYSLALALRIAGRLNDYDCRHGGDGDYDVREIATGRKVYGYSAPVLADEDFPF